MSQGGERSLMSAIKPTKRAVADEAWTVGDARTDQTKEEPKFGDGESIGMHRRQRASARKDD